MSEKTFAAFFSYVHDDDAHDNGRITKLRQMLEEEVRALSGEDFEIFQDYEDIHWGQKWEERLNGAIDGSTFLISVVTPRYLRKEFCRKEILRFIGRERQLNRNDLVLSIYYIDTELSDTNDPVVSAISGHQYFDWRDLRHEPHINPEVGKRIEKMAREIIAAIRRSALISTKTTSIVEKTINATSLSAQDSESAPSIETGQPSKRLEPHTITVDPMPRRGDYTTITKAIESAEPGTRILIRPGLYKEALVLDKPLELIGDGERDDIVIETMESSVIEFKTEFGRVSNLTLRQIGGDDFFGVEISQGRLELDDCDISSQSLSCVVIRNGADPRLKRNRIHNSKESGIFILKNGRGFLEDNEICENSFHNVAITDGGNPTLRHNHIYNGYSNGISVYKNGIGLIEDNEIFGNAATGVDIRGSNPTLRRNRITKNKIYGISVEDGDGLFEGNDLRGNENGAWYIDDNSRSKVKRNGNVEE